MKLLFGLCCDLISLREQLRVQLSDVCHELLGVVEPFMLAVSAVRSVPLHLKLSPQLVGVIVVAHSQVKVVAFALDGVDVSYHAECSEVLCILVFRSVLLVESHERLEECF